MGIVKRAVDDLKGLAGELTGKNDYERERLLYKTKNQPYRSRARSVTVKPREYAMPKAGKPPVAKPVSKRFR